MKMDKMLSASWGFDAIMTRSWWLTFLPHSVWHL